MRSMEAHIKPERIYGQLYALWRDSVYIGRATWVKDQIHGDCFIKEVDHKGELVREVYLADYWQPVVNGQ